MKINQIQKNIKSEWREIPAGDVFDFIKTYSFSRDNLNNEILSGGKIGCIHYGDIHSKFTSPSIDLSDIKIPIVKDSDFNPKKEELLKDGDLVVADASEDYAGIGVCVSVHGIKNNKVVGGLHTYVLRDEKGITNEYYRQFIFRNPIIRNQLQKVANGVSVYGISKTAVSKILLPIPPLPEQNRIVSVLETWDKSIENLNKKIEIKKQIKKGLMQDLLTGGKRLAGFKDKWHYLKIKNLTSLVQGVKSNGGDTGYLEIGDVDIDSKSYNLTKKDKLTVKGAVMVPKGTLLISTVRPTRGAITITKENLFVSSAFCKLSIKNLFVYYIVNSKTFLNYLGDNSGGGTYPTCKNEDIIEYEFFVPTSIEEQKAISDIFTIADKEITELEKKLSIIKDQKKFLLNNLITGTIRTPENLKIN